MAYATNPDDGIRIHYEVEGKGPPLLLHTGFAGRLQDWRRIGFVDALQDHYWLIMIDPRGQGLSDKPHDSAAYNLEQFIADVVAVLDDLEISRTHYLGYSMGAIIGFGVGIFAPERLWSLVLGGGVPGWDKPPTVIMPAIEEEVSLFHQGMEAFMDAFEMKYGPAPEIVRQQWMENDGAALAANTLARATYPDMRQQVHKITVPTLLYCGTDDEPFEAVERASQEISNARFLPLEGLNHPQAFRQCERILPHILAFLNEASTPAKLQCSR